MLRQRANESTRLATTDFPFEADIVSQREQRGISQAVSCRALGVSQAWFYTWRRGDVCPRRARRAALATEVARLFKAP